MVRHGKKVRLVHWVEKSVNTLDACPPSACPNLLSVS